MGVSSIMTALALRWVALTLALFALARSRNVAFNVVRDGGVAITFDEFPFVIGPRTVTLKARDVAGLVDPELMAAFE